VQTDFPSTPSASFGRRALAWPGLTLALVAALTAGASLAGCASPPSRDKEVLKRTQPPQPVLTDTAVYGDNVLTVECWLGPTVRLKKASQAEPDHRERSGSPFQPGGSDYSSQEIDEMYGRVNYEHVLPPRLALTLKFINAGARPLAITIADVNSALGDFAPRPETLTVAPGQPGAVDPMLSNQDNNFDELDVTVAIKIAGKTESHVLHLRRSGETPRQD
jgi:hypothetical protein